MMKRAAAVLTNEIRETLIQAAIQARQWAYVPYSCYRVGAAVLTASGRIYDGANIENAAYPTTVCAERVAIFKAVSEGERQFTALAVVTANAGFPCGSCRQVMAEFGLEMMILIADAAGNCLHELRVSDLLPHAFTPDFLSDQSQ
jgi:cytidine deaminase